MASSVVGAPAEIGRWDYLMEAGAGNASAVSPPKKLSSLKLTALLRNYVL